MVHLTFFGLTQSSYYKLEMVVLHLRNHVTVLEVR